MKEKYKMSLFSIIMVSSAFVISVRNLPQMAVTGLEMIFFIVIATIFFFLPASFVSAELATAWPKKGGIFVWVREAFGEKWGFIAVWMQWSYMIISLITMLYFIGGSLAYVFAPSLANSTWFLVLILWVGVWIATYIGYKGQKVSSVVSAAGFLGGVFVPGILIIIMGIIYLLQGNPSNLNFNVPFSSYLPDFSNITTFVLFAGFVRAFTGIEASASHANAVEKPQTHFPIAIFFVLIVGFSINLLGSLSVAVVIPEAEISLVAGVMEAFATFFTKFNIGWIIPIIGLCIVLGATGQVSTWLMGPSKGLMASAQEGNLPRFFQVETKNGTPRHILILQAFCIGIIGTVIMMLPNINIAFWFSVALSIMIYSTMYMLMFISAIYLRIKKPKVKRGFKIPPFNNNIGMYIVAGVGLFTMIFAFIVALLPPAELPNKHNLQYTLSLVISILVIYAIPLIIYLKFRKPAWAETDVALELKKQNLEEEKTEENK
jgi:glutamate:GABA antiporter